MKERIEKIEEVVEGNEEIKEASNEDLLNAYAFISKYNAVYQKDDIERDFGSLDKFMKRRSAIKAEILKRMKGEIDG